MRLDAWEYGKGCLISKCAQREHGRLKWCKLCQARWSFIPNSPNLKSQMEVCAMSSKPVWRTALQLQAKVSGACHSESSHRGLVPRGSEESLSTTNVQVCRTVRKSSAPFGGPGFSPAKRRAPQEGLSAPEVRLVAA